MNVLETSPASSGVPPDRSRRSPRGVKTFLRLITAVLIAMVCSLWPAGRPTVAAGTCSCLGTADAAALGSADAAFIGTLSSYTVTPLANGVNEPATYTFVVESVFKGTVPSTAIVFSFAGPGSCGLVSMETGVRYVVFATLVRSDSFHPTGAPEGKLMSTTCDGTQMLAAGAAAPDYLGNAAPPVTAATGNTLAPVTLELPPAPDTTWKRSLAIVVGAVVAIGIVARLLSGRQRHVVR